jgi:uncharacterized protein involved in type VI secretion and phage assembly
MSNNTHPFDLFAIKVDGTALPDTVLNRLAEAVIEDDLAQPAMFALRFYDPQLTLIDGTQFTLGSEVTISARNTGGQFAVLLTAEVTALEPVLEQFRTELVVRGYDRSHRLYRGYKTRTFLQQTDSDIASTIAREAGLTADVTATAEQHAYVIQDSQTDMEFLRARAARIGFRIAVEGSKLKFRKAEEAPLEAPAQEWTKTLFSFRTRKTGVAQANEVQVRGWDPQAKQAIVGRAAQVTDPNQVGDQKNGGQVAQQAFGSAATLTVCDQPVGTQTEADALAKAVLDQLGANYLSAEGTCIGEPALRAGKLVEIKGVGQRLGGKYFVTCTRHAYTPDGGYMTTFLTSGFRPYSLLAAADGAAPRHAVQGVVVGLVTNINDPDGLGRVKVKFPWLADTEESNWARPASAGGGSQRGLIVLPEVNDEVLVAFEHGDLSRPYIIGGLWNGNDSPPASAVKDGKVLTRAMKTRAGHTLTLQDDDESGDGFIQIKTKSGHILTLSDNDKQIQVKTSNNTVTLDDTGKRVEVKTQSHSITLDDQGRAVKVSSGGDLVLSGPGGTLKIAAGGIELVSNTNLKLQANANLSAQANAMLDVKTSAILSIQGSLVKIN